LRPERRVLILVGPTGVGKTRAAVLLAQALATEIISADSMQLYRGMDIGTAKPSRELLQAVPHHLVSILEPWEGFSAGRFLELSVPIIERLHAEGRIPLVVGGTGLYVRALTRGLFKAPSQDAALRAELLQKEDREPGSLYRQLQRLDPATARSLSPSDLRRIVRALEVCLKTGMPMSELKERFTRALPYQFLKVGLSRQRQELYGLIDQRVEEMLREGFVEEVRALMRRELSSTALQAIGYKELMAYLRGELPYQEAVRLIKRNSRRYAKRQMTWFRKEEGLRWVDITGLQQPREVFRKLKEALRPLGLEL